MFLARMLRWAVVVGVLPLAGCNKQAVLTTPSSAQVGFAESYPTRLGELRTEFSDGEAAARQSFDRVRELPAKLRHTDYGAAQELVRQADAAGRSSYYADEALSQEQTERLFEEGPGTLRRRIAGSVAFAAKEQECAKESADALGAAAAAATERAIARQLDERLSRHSPAAEYIEAERERLGERNVELLEKQAAAITRASFMANVRLALYRRELDELLEDEASVRATLDRRVTSDEAALGKADLSKRQRARLEERLARARAARAALDTEAGAARAAVADLDARSEALGKDYQTLITTVLDELERKKSEPVAAKAERARKSSPAAASPTLAAPDVAPAEPAPAPAEPASVVPAEAAPSGPPATP